MCPKTIKLDQQKRLAIPINGFQKTWKIKLGHVQWPCHVQQFFLRLTAMVRHEPGHWIPNNGWIDNLLLVEG
jgi:hypothetical protein